MVVVLQRSVTMALTKHFTLMNAGEVHFHINESEPECMFLYVSFVLLLFLFFCSLVLAGEFISLHNPNLMNMKHAKGCAHASPGSSYETCVFRIIQPGSLTATKTTRAGRDSKRIP